VNRTLASALLILTAAVSPVYAQQAKTGKATASAAPKQNVKRLQPSELAEQIPSLPHEFVEKLNTRGCTIPQFDYAGNTSPTATEAATQPNNVIEGEFAKKGQKDWAVLCSNGKTSTIVIFWAKPTSCPASLARLDDAHYLKPAKDKKLHYSRSIRPLGETDLGQRPGLSTLRPLQHQGIDDRFVGKSSAFFYCDAGKWRIFPAKDPAPGFTYDRITPPTGPAEPEAPPDITKPDGKR
jgi:hypothetical protein